jgi:mannose-6-phosphate isomerase-like protein (cupin superfamily)
MTVPREGENGGRRAYGKNRFSGCITYRVWRCMVKSMRKAVFCGTLVLLLFAFAPFAGAADPLSQAVVNYADILKANPLPAGEKAQTIKVGEDETASVFVGRFTPGVEVKPHFHKNHSETIYVIEGSGQMVIGGNVVEIKPGTVHFNGKGNVHSVKNTGSSDLIVIQVFAPAWKEPDRVMVP